MLKLSVPAAVAAALLAGAAVAAPPPSSGTTASGPRTDHVWHHSMHRGWHGDRWMGTLRQLDLTDAQRTGIRDLMRQGFQQARPEMTALREKRTAFEAATPGSAEYQAAANDLGHAEANAALARMLQRADLRTKVYQLLTPAQRTQLATLRAQRQERRQWQESHRPSASRPDDSAS